MSCALTQRLVISSEEQAQVSHTQRVTDYVWPSAQIASESFLFTVTRYMDIVKTHLRRQELQVNIHLAEWQPTNRFYIQLAFLRVVA